MLKTRIATTIILGAIILSACGGVTPYPIPTISSPTLIFPTTTPLPTFTSMPTITPTFENTPTPETLYGYPTPQAAVLPTCNPIDCLELTPNVQRQDFTFHELYVGKYVLRNWCNIDPSIDLPYPYCAVTISSKGSKQIELWGWPAYFGEETGANLTGDGKPDIVIIDWFGGNCCVDAIVYEAGDSLKKIMDVGSHWVGTFTDLNGDGTYEYVATDRIWSEFCEGCTVWPSIVYEYQSKLGYVPATYKFKDVFVPWSHTLKSSLATDIQKDLDFLNQFTKHNPKTTLLFIPPNTDLSLTPGVEEQEYWQYANENSDYSQAVNALYELAAYYLLAGQPTDAQNILNKYFPHDKASAYMLGIQNDLQSLLAP
jgi:hypothetical protein